MTDPIVPGDRIIVTSTPRGEIEAGEGCVLEVFDEPRAPLAYVEFDAGKPRWVFATDLDKASVTLPA